MRKLSVVIFALWIKQFQIILLDCVAVYYKNNKICNTIRNISIFHGNFFENCKLSCFIIEKNMAVNGKRTGVVASGCTRNQQIR